MTNPYEVLGLGRDASVDEVRKRYRSLARRYHPDVNSGDATANWMFRAIKDAHDQILGEEAHRRETRQRADRERRQQSPPADGGSGWNPPRSSADDGAETGEGEPEGWSLAEFVAAYALAAAGGAATGWYWDVAGIGAELGEVWSGRADWNLAASLTTLFTMMGCIMTIKWRRRSAGAPPRARWKNVAYAAAMTAFGAAGGTAAILLLSRSL